MDQIQSNPVLRKYSAEAKKLAEERAEIKTEIAQMPKKANYRMRAHCNPLSDTPFPLLFN